MHEKNDATFTFVFKPLLLFFFAYVLHTTLHELTHAVAAAAYGIDATLYHYYVNTDQPGGSEWARSIVAFSGPLASLLTGLFFLLWYRNEPRSSMRLFLLYAATIGIGIFLGNLFSATFGGDVARAAQLLYFTPAIRYTVSFLGLVFSILFMYRMGKEFLCFAVPAAHSRVKLIVYTILLPWLGGIVLVAMAYWPLPPGLLTAMVASSVFWLFTLIGSIVYKLPETPAYLLRSIRWVDLILFLVAVVVVRLLTYGISF
jgi:hypothetical protein